MKTTSAPEYTVSTLIVFVAICVTGCSCQDPCKCALLELMVGRVLLRLRMGKLHMCVTSVGACLGDQDAALRYLDLRLGIFADPIYLGMLFSLPTNPQVVLLSR